ncbi:unnamed protein product [Peronospora effusa]|nr:unnamed protein product [Peronospora effusa]
MKTHPIFYVGRLKRYVDPEEITYPHQYNENDGDVDCESSVAADQATGKVNEFPYTNEAIEDLAIKEDSALNAGISSPVARVCPTGLQADIPLTISRIHSAQLQSQSRDLTRQVSHMFLHRSDTRLRLNDNRIGSRK